MKAQINKTSRAIFTFALAATALLSTSKGHAFDRDLLNKAVENTYQERAGVEKNYHSNQAIARPNERLSEPKAINLEIGDELSARSAPERQVDRPAQYREKHISRKLDREWKEVNRAVQKNSF